MTSFLKEHMPLTIDFWITVIVDRSPFFKNHKTGIYSQKMHCQPAENNFVNLNS